MFNRILAAVAISAFAVACFAQDDALPSAPAPQVEVEQAQQGSSPAGSSNQDQTPPRKTRPASPANSNAGVPRVEQQPTRLFGVMPNYRAVSAGAQPPPPTPKEAFMVATRNSFDYSAFVFVGVTSLLAEWDNSHSQLGKGVGGFWAYSWRGYVDKTDGNYMVDFVFPSFLHEDERYYAMGYGNAGMVHRGVYAATRIFITPNDHGQNTINGAELLGRGVSQGISLAYYPSQTQTFSGFSEKYAYALGRDALTNVVREFTPDIYTLFDHLRHRHHEPPAVKATTD